MWIHFSLSICRRRDEVVNIKQRGQVLIFEFLVVNPGYETSPQERSLDELPQIINVSRGKISLVGFVPIFRGNWKRWEDMKEGIFPERTGIWS